MGSSGGELKELAAQAREAFHAGRFDEALSSLQKIAASQLPTIDTIRVQANTAVTSYYARGSSDPVRLLEALLRLRKRSAGDESRQDDAEGAEEGLVDDVDLALVDYNQAVLFYQAKQYGRAAALLERLFAAEAALDEALGTRVCFLLLDLYLGQGQPERAAPVLAWLERAAASALKVTSGEGGSGAAAEEAAHAALLAGRAYRPGDSAPPLAIPQPQLRFQMLLARARQHLLGGAFKAAKREIKSAINTYGQQPVLFFLKAHLEFNRGAHRKAIKLLAGAMAAPANPRQPPPASDPVYPFLYYNNLGCLHSRLGKHNAAAFYFTRALRDTEALYPHPAPAPPAAAGDFGLNRGAARVLPAYARDRKCEIFYNLGVQLLLGSRPALAFSCFQESAPQLYNRPSLWIRLAECCVAHHAAKKEKAELVKGAYGSGARRHVLLPGGGPGLAGPAQDEGPVFSQRILQGTPDAGPPPGASASGANGAESLLYAAKCCRNALHLLSRPPPPPPPPRPAPLLAPRRRRRRPRAALPAHSRASSPGPGRAPPPAGAPARGEHRRGGRRGGGRAGAPRLDGGGGAPLPRLRLPLPGDPAAALAAAGPLASAASPAHRLLAAVYSAEALASLGRPQEAAAALEPRAVSELLEEPGRRRPSPPAPRTPAPSSASTWPPCGNKEAAVEALRRRRPAPGAGDAAPQPQ
eukprot:tig00000391_g24839.t1